MRLHIGQHLINNNIDQNTRNCGFCGNVGCSIAIVHTTGRGSNKTMGPSAPGCKYFYKFSLASAAKVNDSSPCTNRPVECDLFKLVFWSYNMRSHYDEVHSSNELPARFLLSNDEIVKVKALSFK